MQHSAPKPLAAAQMIARRLLEQMGEILTPEQRRDFTRVERLLGDAERLQNEEVFKARQLAAGIPSPRGKHYVRPRVR